MPYKINEKPMDKWDERFCKLARYISEWSKDPNAQVGAVLFSKRGGNITTGYNGFPMGVEDSDERLDVPEKKLEFVVHAEVNALIAAGERAAGATLYVWGKPICARCAGPIIQAGVKRVVALDPTTIPPTSKWHETGMFALEMFREAAVTVDFYTAEVIEEQKAQ